MKLRIERLKEIIRQTIAEAIVHDLADPRLGFCTVTRVELVDDLSHCTVFISVYGSDSDKSKSIHALQDSRGYLQKLIAKQLKTRTTPHLKIELDETIEKSFAVFEKIREARQSDLDVGKAPEDPSKKDEKDSDNVESAFDD